MTTMLDKCAVAGDITQAIDRRGAWTVAVTIIGGTESTAVKLQSAETADGEFTDFKTLIASADASAEQYKGFVVDLHGAKQFIKVTGATMATAVLGDCDHDLKKVAVKAGEIPSGGSATAYAWVAADDSRICYTDFDIAPSNQAEYENALYLSLSSVNKQLTVSPFGDESDVYTRISDTEFSATGWNITFTRDSTKDFTLW